MRKFTPRRWRFPIARDDYRDSYKVYDNSNGGYYYICNITLLTQEIVENVYFGASFIAAEMHDRQGIPARLYGAEISKMLMLENHACSSNEKTKLLMLSGLNPTYRPFMTYRAAQLPTRGDLVDSAI